MTLQPIKDVSEYKRLKQTLRDRFESEKTGDQTLLEEQTEKNINASFISERNFKDHAGCCGSNSGKSEQRTSSIATVIALVTKYTENTSSCSEATTTIADRYHSIELRHSPIVYCRTGCEISYSATSSTGFILQRFN